MKKLFCLIISIAICLSSVNAIFAAEDSGISEALLKVKERIDTTEYDDFKSSYHKDEDGKVSYQFNWSKTEDEYAGLYVTFSDGIITNYSKYDYEKDGSFGALSLSEADALNIAEDFVKRINPDICENIRIKPQNSNSIQSDYYNMKIYRTQNGIPVLGDTGYISVSKSTREIDSFYISYTLGIDFKPSEGVISEEAAKKAYKQLISPILRYKLKRDYQKAEITAYLEYVSKDGSLAVNAYDGSVYELEYSGDRFYSDNMAAKSEEAAGDRGFTPAELEETERVAGLLSEEQARRIIADNEIIAMPKGFKQESASLNRDFYNKNEYQYEFGFGEDEKGYVSVNIDAKNGEILSFYKYISEYEEPKYDKAAEKRKAAAAFKNLAGEKSAEFRITEEEGDGYLAYIRTYDGLDVIGDGAHFSFDAKDNISSYSLNYTKNVQFPSKNGVISSDEALDIAFGEVGFELAYAVNNKDKTAQPVYMVGKDGEACGFTMNPFTGHLTDYNGDDLKEAEKITYSDIENHYAKGIFEALSEYGIGFAGGKLRPDEPITQAEFFTLLNKAFGYETDIDSIYRRLILRGTVSAEERADSSILTREKSAIFMIREMGAEEYAKYDEIFVSPFDDVTENKGYVAILKAKGIINGDGSGNFYPQKTVTRGEALIMLYNYFSVN